ncbi:hypothetical protein YC2023_050774 [Brassica napus]
MKESSSCPVVASTSRSICGNGKLSYGHALLRSVKLMHTLHFPFFFLTTTGFASQSGYWTSRMEPIFRSLSTSSFTALARPGPNFLHFCLMGLNVGSTFRSWEATLISIPGISAADHANILIFCLRNDKRSRLNFGGKPFPMLTLFSGELSSRGTVLDKSLAGSLTERSRASGIFSSLCGIFRNSNM